MKYFNNRQYLLILFIISLIISSLGMNNQPGAQLIIHRGNLYYFTHTVVIKIKNQTSGGISKVQSLTSRLNTNLGRFKFSSAKEMFGTNSVETSLGLNRIVVVKYDAPDDPFYVALKIKSSDNNIEWAEPKYVRRPAYIPNDSSLSAQYYLSLIHAGQAWDISQGDTNVVIGIVDTGVDWPHPDLYANIWHNWKDINNNWSGNSDGIIGDSIGWDFGGAGDGQGNPTPDSNPIEDIPSHGTLVAGVACAVTNNTVGVAGVGYNCRIMPVKVSQANFIDPISGAPYILYGFEGIKYAADNGAKVINCSWGGGGYSNAEKEIIDYAISKGALIVAAAGNDGVSEKFYPAAYPGVLSVAASVKGDYVAAYSNFGSTVSLVAPGTNIYSTWQPNTYLAGVGTSFASPMVAGAAALVTSRFPNYLPRQVAEQIRVNCDNIDAANPAYKYQIGGGRLNAYRALADSNSESVRAVSIQCSDAAPGGNGNGELEPGENVTVDIKFINYLRPIRNLKVSLISMNDYAKVNNSSFSISGVPTLNTFDNYNSKFSFTLTNTIPYDQTIQFRLDYSDRDYSDFQIIEFTVNQTYATESGNNVSLTIASKGSLGFSDYPVNLCGDGFQFKNSGNLLFEGALMYANSLYTINDAARNGIDVNSHDNSFQIEKPFKLLPSKDSTYQHGVSLFNDYKSETSLGIATRLDSYNFNTATDSNYIILKYSFVNKSSYAISNFYAGIFFDWDMIDGSGDSTFYDKEGNMGFVEHAASTFNTAVATALISSTSYGYWAIQNDGSDGNFGVYKGFTVYSKWKALSSKIGKSGAGVGDISEVTSGGPFTIKAHDTIKVAFALAAGNNINDLRNTINNARTRYNQMEIDSNKIIIPVGGDSNKIIIPGQYSYNLSQNYPNPFNPSTLIKYQIAVAGHVTLKIYDILGREAAVLVDAVKPAGIYSAGFNSSSLGGRHASGIYFYQIRSGSYVATKKMILIK